MAEDDDYIPLTETDEWKAARKRRGAPRGAHIRKKPNADDPIEMSREEMFEELLRIKGEEKDMVISGVKFDRSISLGALCGILMSVIGFGTSYGVFTRWQGDVENRLKGSEQNIADIQKAADARVTKYAPQIDSLQRLMDVTSDRFNNTSNGLVQLRDIVTDLAKSVAQTHEEIMVFKARMGYDKRTELQPPVPSNRKGQ